MIKFSDGTTNAERLIDQCVARNKCVPAWLWEQHIQAQIAPATRRTADEIRQEYDSNKPLDEREAIVENAFENVESASDTRAVAVGDDKDEQRD